MQPHLSNLQFIVAVVALAFVAVLALAIAHRHPQRRRTPPFLNYFYSDFDPDQYDRDTSTATPSPDSTNGAPTIDARPRIRSPRHDLHHGLWD